MPSSDIALTPPLSTESTVREEPPKSDNDSGSTTSLATHASSLLSAPLAGPATGNAAPDEEYVIEDSRWPLFLSPWRRSKADRDPPRFAQDSFDEPHKKRRLTILARYPQVKELYGHEPMTFWAISLAVLVQLVVCRLLSLVHVHWTVFVALAYVVGGTATHVSGVVIHECGHSLVHPRPLFNKLVGLLSNVIIPVPMAMSFRRYHFEHHTYQGVERMDPDLPLAWESWLIRGNAAMKAAWLAIYPLMYVIRGAALGKPPSPWEVINWIVTLLTDYLIVFKLSGWTGLVYLMLSLWLGYSFHPAAAHFIQEHYTFADGQETYSYYGWMNALFLNIGYHNEHHDFPQVQATLLISCLC